MTKFKLIWKSEAPDQIVEGDNINQALLDNNYPFGSLEDLHHYEELSKEE